MIRALLVCLLLYSNMSFADEAVFEYSGNISAEITQYNNSALFKGQDMSTYSVALEPEFYYEKNNYNISAKLFGRLDSADHNRTHADIREFIFKKTISDKLDIAAGIGSVFWGVTEARNIVDIINQQDTVEGPLSTEKLGQPMLNSTYYSDNLGTIDVFILPAFRERTFAGRKGRSRTIPGPDTHQRAIYESANRSSHIDYGIRLMKRFSAVDIGISNFYGTSREPLFSLGLNSKNELVQVPIYNIINQMGLEVQYAKGDTLYKLEAIFRSGQEDDFIMLDAGFEHNFVGIFNSQKDVALLVEYLHEGRPSSFVNDKLVFNPYTNDLMVGARLNFNDVNSSEATFTITFDLKNSSKILSLDINRRIKDNWKISLTGMGLVDIPLSDPVYSMRNDSYLRLNLEYYF